MKNKHILKTFNVDEESVIAMEIIRANGFTLSHVVKEALKTKAKQILESKKQILSAFNNLR